MTIEKTVALMRQVCRYGLVGHQAIRLLAFASWRPIQWLRATILRDAKQSTRLETKPGECPNSAKAQAQARVWVWASWAWAWASWAWAWAAAEMRWDETSQDEKGRNEMKWNEMTPSHLISFHISSISLPQQSRFVARSASLVLVKRAPRFNDLSRTLLVLVIVHRTIGYTNTVILKLHRNLVNVK